MIKAKCEVCNNENLEKSNVCNHCGWEIKHELDNLSVKSHADNILLTTTNKIEGYEITEYIDIITKQIVVGAGMYTEFFAGFTDVYGGRSAKVESRLSELTEIGRSEIMKIAKNKNADAIIGFSLDIDEISGKNTFMFMINVSGTAVKLRKIESYSEKIMIKTFPNYIYKMDSNIRIYQTNLKIINNELEVALLGEFYDEDIEYIMCDIIFDFVLGKKIKYSEQVFRILKQNSTKSFITNSITIFKDTLPNVFITGTSVSVTESVDKNGMMIIYEGDDIKVSNIKEVQKARTLLRKDVFEIKSADENKWVCSCGQTNPLEMVFCKICKRKFIPDATSEIIDLIRVKKDFITIKQYLIDNYYENIDFELKKIIESHIDTQISIKKMYGMSSEREEEEKQNLIKMITTFQDSVF